MLLLFYYKCGRNACQCARHKLTRARHELMVFNVSTRRFCMSAAMPLNIASFIYALLMENDLMLPVCKKSERPNDDRSDFWVSSLFYYDNVYAARRQFAFESAIETMHTLLRMYILRRFSRIFALRAAAQFDTTRLAVRNGR